MTIYFEMPILYFVSVRYEDGTVLPFVNPNTVAFNHYSGLLSRSWTSQFRDMAKSRLGFISEIITNVSSQSRDSTSRLSSRYQDSTFRLSSRSRSRPFTQLFVKIYYSKKIVHFPFSSYQVNDFTKFEFYFLTSIASSYLHRMCNMYLLFRPCDVTRKIANFVVIMTTFRQVSSL